MALFTHPVLPVDGQAAGEIDVVNVPPIVPCIIHSNAPDIRVGTPYRITKTWFTRNEQTTSEDSDEEGNKFRIADFETVLIETYRDCAFLCDVCCHNFNLKRSQDLAHFQCVPIQN